MDSSLVLFLIVNLSFVTAELQFIDLTHTFGKATIPWNPVFNLSSFHRADIANGAVVVANVFETAEHSGTHMDAPRHFCPAGKQVHEIPIDKLSGPGIVLDFEEEANKDTDFTITVQHIKDWEEQNGIIPEGAIVITKFGLYQHWLDWKKLFKTDRVKDVRSYRWPAISVEASAWLAGERQILALGTDAPSPDLPKFTSFPVHRNLLCDHEVIILENVGNVAALPTTGSRIFVGAIKLEHGSGTPVRLFATVGSGSCGISGLPAMLLIIPALVFVIL